MPLYSEKQRNIKALERLMLFYVKKYNKLIESSDDADLNKEDFEEITKTKTILDDMGAAYLALKTERYSIKKIGVHVYVLVHISICYMKAEKAFLKAKLE